MPVEPPGSPANTSTTQASSKSPAVTVSYLYSLLWRHFYLICTHQVTVDYKSGTRDLVVTTPTRRAVIKQVYRREYGSAHKLLQTEMTPDESALNFARLLMGEIKDMSHLDSVFYNTTSVLHNFTWDIVWEELQNKAPTLLRFYRHMFRGASKPLISFAISLILKWRSDGMGLVQRVISCLMYGNGSSKQVCMYVCVKYVHFDCYIDVQLFPATNGLPLLYWNDGPDEKASKDV